MARCYNQKRLENHEKRPKFCQNFNFFEIFVVKKYLKMKMRLKADNEVWRICLATYLQKISLFGAFLRDYLHQSFEKLFKK